MHAYWANNGLYEPGEMIPPGNWGRVVMGAGALHSWYSIEMFFEAVRRAEFPDAPSRLKSLMISDDEMAGRAWVQRERNLFYEVALANEPSKLDVGWINQYINGATHSYEEALEFARHYWAGDVCEFEGASQFELLTEQPATVVRRIP